MIAKRSAVAVAVALISATAVVTGCATTDTPSRTAAPVRVSPDYMASGDTSGLRAYWYGKATVLEVKGSFVFVSVTDEAGETVETERTGKFYRIGRALDKFTVSVNGRKAEFTRIVQNKKAATLSAEQTLQPVVTVVEETPKFAMQLAEITEIGNELVRLAAEMDATKSELRAVEKRQISETKRAIERARGLPETTGNELFEVVTRLDAIERKLAVGDSYTITVRFPLGVSTYKPTPEVKSALIRAAKLAKSVHIRGRTDSVIPLAVDGPLAAARAAGARAFLIAHGLSPDKIRVSSEAAGSLAAPSNTKEGRALNRRVDIEILIEMPTAPALAKA